MRKNEEFEGRKSIMVPRKLIEIEAGTNKIIDALTVTDIGYFPRAKTHYIERIHGVDQHIIIYCLEGKGIAEIDKRVYAVKAGEFIIIPACLPHSYEADDINPWTIYWIHFKGNTTTEIVRTILKQSNGYKGQLCYNENRISLFMKIYNQLEKGFSGDNLMYANLNVWSYLSSFMFPEQNYYSDKIFKQDIIVEAINFMTSNVDSVLQVDNIAQSVNLSVSHFTALFRRKTGYSPIGYYNNLKIQKACQYLFFTDLRIKEISVKLGINDPYYFSRLFSKKMGVSPNEYRLNKQINLL